MTEEKPPTTPVALPAPESELSPATPVIDQPANIITAAEIPADEQRTLLITTTTAEPNSLDPPIAEHSQDARTVGNFSDQAANPVTAPISSEPPVDEQLLNEANAAVLPPESPVAAADYDNTAEPLDTVTEELSTEETSTTTTADEIRFMEEGGANNDAAFTEQFLIVAADNTEPPTATPEKPSVPAPENSTSKQKVTDPGAETGSEEKPKSHEKSEGVDKGPARDDLFTPFQVALASRFDKVPLVWGKDALSLTTENFQNRLKERKLQAELLKANEISKEPSAVAGDKGMDKKSKPERRSKYEPLIQMYQPKPAVSEEKLTEMIWGTYTQRTIDLFYAWEQARQSSEVSHILERITNIEGVKAFIIFDIYEKEQYPKTEEHEDDYEEDENGMPIQKDAKLELVDGKWQIPAHIIYSSTDLQTAKKLIPFTKQLIWRLVETTRDLDPKNEVRYLRLISDVNEILVMPMFPRHFLIAVQEPCSAPNKLFEKMGLVTTHPVVVEEDFEAKRHLKPRPAQKKKEQTTAVEQRHKSSGKS